MPKNPPNLFNFWNELKRRKVVKASLVYLAVAFGILQAGDIIFPALGLPAWTITFVLILLIIVFILVIVLTWVYDITPEGIKVTRDEKEESEEKDKVNQEIDLKSIDNGKSPGVVLNESDLEQKVRVLEDQLKEARKYSVRSLLSVSIKKLGFYVAIVVILLLIVFNKQRLIKALGFGDARREVAMAHNAKAAVYIKAEDFDAARRELELALASDPGYSYAWGNMAVVSYRLGDLNKAVIQAMKAINLDPRNSFAPYNLAFALHDKKDYKQAIRWYREAIRIDSTYMRDSVYTASCSALGNLYNSIELPADAILILTRAMDRYPQSQNINYIFKNLGNAYLLLEQPDSALKYLVLSNELEPMEPQTNRLLAMAYEATGQMTKCIEQWKVYIDMETDTANAGEARRHLKEVTRKYLLEIMK